MKILLTLLLSICLWADQTAAFLEALSGYYDNDPSNDARTITLLRKEALAGNNDAAYLLGAAYDNGVLVRGSCTEALRWYELAAKRGDSDAQMQTAWHYYRSSGCPHNIETAYRWFLKAAEAGEVEAQRMLELLEEGF